MKELEYSQRSEEDNRKLAENKKKVIIKTKLILLAIWLILVITLFLLSNYTLDSAGFSPYQLILITVLIFGIVILIKEIVKFFKND